MIQNEVNKNYLLIGSGKMARHLERYFLFKKIPFSTWNRKNHSITELENLCFSNTIVLLAISDDSIEPFIKENFFLMNYPLIHFSGSLYTSFAIGFHPLMTFSNDLKDETFYSDILFVTDSKESFQYYFPQLTNPSLKINPEQKKLYHALCVLLGNGSQVLWNACFEEFEKVGVEKKFLFNYLAENLINFISLGSAALTGPWVRQDQKTIAANKVGLQNNKLLSVYESLESVKKSEIFYENNL